MIVAGTSGNELYCLDQKGFSVGELVVGNSVVSLGIVGGLGAFGRNLAGGEVANVTSLISEGRHAAIDRMEAEAKKHDATGVSSVVSELRTLGGYTEVLSQGTARALQMTQRAGGSSLAGIRLVSVSSAIGAMAFSGFITAFLGSGHPS